MLKRTITILSLLAALPVVARGDACPQLMGALAEPNGSLLLRPGAVHEAEVLAGEASPELNAARRELMKQLKGDPALAQALAAKLSAKGFASGRRPGEVLLALDAFTRVNLDLFVEVASGVMKGALPAGREAALLPAVKRQLASRLISSLNLLNGPQALTIIELMAKAPWARKYLAQDANAARALLTAINKIKVSAASDPAFAKRLAPVRLLAADWITPRRAYDLHRPAPGRAAPAPLSQLPETDWAFSRVLAVEVSRLLKATDPTNAARFEAAGRELSRAPRSGEYRKNERVKALFAEFGVEE